MLSPRQEFAHSAECRFADNRVFSGQALVLPSGFLKSGLYTGPIIQDMSSPKVLFGFHAVGVRLKTAPQSVIESLFRSHAPRCAHAPVPGACARSRCALIEADGLRLAKLCRQPRPPGRGCRVQALAQIHSLDDLLDSVEGPPLLLVLDGVTDPHNLGACLRVADGAGAHAVIAPKDHACGHQCHRGQGGQRRGRNHALLHGDQPGAYLGELKERSIWCIGTSDDAPKTLYQADLKAPWPWCWGPKGRACASSRARPAMNS
jgi:23S rRNA (guanosine2251-2'-O)-methyltransferase